MSFSQADESPPETKFAKSIAEGWKRACETYLKESGLKDNSEEWKYIDETKNFSQNFSQIIEVLNATWAHYNSPSDGAQFIVSQTPSVKHGGFRAGVKRKFNQLIGRKETGKIFVQPETKVQPVYDRLQLEQKLLGKQSSVQDTIDTALQTIDQISNLEGSETIKTVVHTVVEFANILQPLATMSDLVGSLKSYLTLQVAPYASFAYYIFPTSDPPMSLGTTQIWRRRGAELLGGVLRLDLCGIGPHCVASEGPIYRIPAYPLCRPK